MLSKSFFSLLACTTAALAATCSDNGGGTVPVSDAQSCVDYIRNKGTTGCAVDGENVVFCTAGNAQISGSNVNLQDSPTSNCNDVAAGAQSIIDSCAQNGQVAGYNAAGGNGDIIVSINVNA
ncbi:uncharacterized protein BDV17DRAFT_294754 [Aspergillus undulatus]|uniref:uncharacterized protein n=1 Tax=Aspergillus undulatus TaxID=1810928 RepID=UPI003CCDB030